MKGMSLTLGHRHRRLPFPSRAVRVPARDRVPPALQSLPARNPHEPGVRGLQRRGRRSPRLRPGDCRGPAGLTACRPITSFYRSRERLVPQDLILDDPRHDRACRGGRTRRGLSARLQRDWRDRRSWCSSSPSSSARCRCCPRWRSSTRMSYLAARAGHLSPFQSTASSLVVTIPATLVGIPIGTYLLMVTDPDGDEARDCRVRSPLCVVVMMLGVPISCLALQSSVHVAGGDCSPASVLGATLHRPRRHGLLLRAPCFRRRRAVPTRCSGASSSPIPSLHIVLGNITVDAPVAYDRPGSLLSGRYRCGGMVVPQNRASAGSDNRLVAVARTRGDRAGRVTCRPGSGRRTSGKPHRFANR